MNERLNIDLIEQFANGNKDMSDILRHDIANMELLIENMTVVQSIDLNDTGSMGILNNMTFVFECGAEDDWEYEFEPGEIDKAHDLLADLRTRLFEANKEF